MSVSAARAQPEVGRIAALEGQAELGRGGAWRAAALGEVIHPGDALRTGRPGRMRIALRDESALVLGDDSEIVIDRQVFDPDAGTFDSVVEVVTGALRTLVSEYYDTPRARFEIRTRTAVAGVRGTEFIVVFDPAAALTRVVGVSGAVTVRGSVDPTGPGVLVGAREISFVAAGQLPTPPQPLGDAEFRGYLDAVRSTGARDPEGFSAHHPLLAGSQVPLRDRVDAPGMERPLAEARAHGMLPDRGPSGEFPRDVTPDLGGLLGQPLDAIEAGELGIEF